MTDPLQIHYASEDQTLEIHIQEGTSLFYLPPEYSKAAAVICDVLCQMIPDEESQKYLRQMEGMILREGASVQ